METHTSAGYHLTDDRLFEVFGQSLPREYLISVLKGAPDVRKRAFSSHKITDSWPTTTDLLKVFRKESIARGWSVAWRLSCGWTAVHHEIATAGLQALSIPGNHPNEPDRWLKEIQTSLQRPNWRDNVRLLVRTLKADYSADDIRILVSIFGGGLNPTELQAAVEEELTRPEDPAALISTLQNHLEEVRRTVVEIQAAKLKNDDVHSGRSATSAAGLAALTEEQSVVAAQCTELEAAVAATTVQVATLNEQLSNEKAGLRSARHEKEKLVKALEQMRRSMASDRVDFENSSMELSQQYDECAARMLKLSNQLEDLLTRPEPAPAPVPAAAPTPKPAVKPITKVSIPAAPERLADNMIKTDNNSVCYWGTQRIFRNAVVNLLRERLQRLFPTDHIERLKKPFQRDWDKTADHARYSRESGGTTTTVRDDYDLLGTNHFYSLFDMYYEQLLSEKAGHPQDRPKPTKTRLLVSLKTIKDFRDPNSHPVEQEVPEKEAHHLLLDTVQVLEWLGCDAAAAEVTALDAQLSGRRTPKITVLRKLPSEDSIYLDFVGRDTLLNDLKTWFAKPDSKRCVLAGDGGKGKSAVAYRFAQHLADTTGRFHIVLWLSAKQRKFSDGATVPIDSPDFMTLEGAVNRLLVEYGALTDDLQQPLDDRIRVLLQYLTDYPAFIVADDIDSVLDDDAVVGFFSYDIPMTSSAVLLTSRRAIPGVRSLVVKGFEEGETEQFVLSRSHLYELDPKPFTPKVIRQMGQATDGSPLYLDDLLKLIRVLDLQDAIQKWTDRKGDEARKYALLRELEKLSEDARMVLNAAAISDHPISLAELESILSFSEDRLLSALKELQTMFLMPQASVAEGEKRFQLNLNTRKLVRLVEEGSDRYKRIQNASKVLSGKLPASGPSVTASLIRQAQLRLNSGKNAECEKMLTDGIERYPNALDLRVYLAGVYKQEGRIADARIQFEKTARLKNPTAEMFIQWVQMEIEDKEWTRAFEAADKGLRIVQDCYSLIEKKAYAQCEAAWDLWRGNHQEKALKMWSDTVELLSRRIKSPEKLPAVERNLNTSMFHTIVVSLHMLGRHDERNQWLTRWEKEHPNDPQTRKTRSELRSNRGTFGADAS